eukprot:8644602-Heterocapsa_arctica.AAC.1
MCFENDYRTLPPPVSRHLPRRSIAPHALFHVGVLVFAHVFVSRLGESCSQIQPLRASTLA